jgi:thiamine pyrophosphate-dependent acetolactate synthase large subunit-like protein
MSQTVAGTLVDVLEEVGVRQIFGLIGDSLNPIADAVRHSEIEWIGVRHEEGAALAAAGQAKLTGRLGVCCGTTGPGGTHLVAGLYEANRDHAPVLALSGEMPRQKQGTDYFQATDSNLLFRDVSLYTETISSPGQAPAVIHQAIAAAYAGRGVAHLTLPQDVIGATSDGSVTSVTTLKQRTEISAGEADIAEMARRIDEADRVVIMCGAGCHGAAEELRALSDRLKASLIHSFKGKDIMPYNDPRWMGGIGMIGTKPVYQAAMHCDLFLMLGTDYPYSEFLPRKGAFIQVDDRARVLGRRTPTALGVNGSVRPTIRSLLSRVKPKGDSEFFDFITDRRKAWDEMLDKQSDLAREALLNVQPVSVNGLSGDAVAVTVRTVEGEQKIEGSDLVVAVGRVANTIGIGPDEAGVELDGRGFIRVNERLQTTAAGVWAIGKCCGSPHHRRRIRPAVCKCAAAERVRERGTSFASSCGCSLVMEPTLRSGKSRSCRRPRKLIGARDPVDWLA